MRQELSVTIEIAHAAGEIIRENFGKLQEVAYKGDVNPVTETDTAAESLILARLEEAFPQHRILGEESGGSDWQTDDAIWLVDPLDGTNNFTHGFPHVCVSIALWADREPLVGVIYDPLRDETFAAEKGGGATLNGYSIYVSPVKKLAKAFLATGFPYARRVAADNNTRRLDHFLRRSEGVRRAGAAALDLAYVACGRFDGYWEADLHPWDVAAGILLVQEAGGRTSNYVGAWDAILSGEEIVASNGHIHEQMLRVLREGAAAPHPDFPALSAPCEGFT